jgi:hypothetical protein
LLPYVNIFFMLNVKAIEANSGSDEAIKEGKMKAMQQ